MPFKRVGKQILHYKNGRWTVKQTASSVENAKKTLKLLNAIEYGGLKPKKK